jgi:hypothetical protein
LSAVVPVGSDWVRELKHDGWRILARKDGGSLRLWSRKTGVTGLPVSRPSLRPRQPFRFNPAFWMARP